MAEGIPENTPPSPDITSADFLCAQGSTLSDADLDALHRVAAFVPEFACTLTPKPKHPMTEVISYLARLATLDRDGRCWGYDRFL